VAVSRAAATAMTVICHPAMPPATMVWTTVGAGCGGAAADDPSEMGLTTIAKAEGANKMKPKKLAPAAATTLTARRMKRTWFMRTS
jgi:hypothetical protein